jgi:hypothetical protein
MRLYDVAVASFALRVDRKWLDNLLSQHDVPGVSRSVQGLARQIPLRSLAIIAIVRDLQRQLGLGVGRGLQIAARLVGPSHGNARAGIVSLTVDVSALERELDHRLVDAMETVVPKPRGRKKTPKRRS